MHSVARTFLGIMVAELKFPLRLGWPEDVARIEFIELSPDWPEAGKNATITAKVKIFERIQVCVHVFRNPIYLTQNTYIIFLHYIGGGICRCTAQEGTYDTRDIFLRSL